MADVDSVQNGLTAAALGCNWIGTTLYGYTETTSDRTPPGLEMLPDLRRALEPSVRLICEGGITSPGEAQSALNAGADNVVVGAAITGIDLKVAAYCRKLTA
jgi:N-acylglucosamine-6-phosphate 2-epimerase